MKSVLAAANSLAVKIGARNAATKCRRPSEVEVY